jgi:hypothetical protein
VTHDLYDNYITKWFIYCLSKTVYIGYVKYSLGNFKEEESPLISMRPPICYKYDIVNIQRWLLDKRHYLKCCNLTDVLNKLYLIYLDMSICVKSKGF